MHVCMYPCALRCFRWGFICTHKCHVKAFEIRIDPPILEWIGEGKINTETREQRWLARNGHGRPTIIGYRTCLMEISCQWKKLCRGFTLSDEQLLFGQQLSRCCGVHSIFGGWLQRRLSSKISPLILKVSIGSHREARPEITCCSRIAFNRVYLSGNGLNTASQVDEERVSRV